MFARFIAVSVECDVIERGEVVLDGVRGCERKLILGSEPTGAGHLHADGTWHGRTNH